MSKSKSKSSSTSVTRTLNSLDMKRQTNSFFDAIDPNQFSAACELDPRFEGVRLAMMDPAYQRWSMAAILKRFNLSVADCVDLWRNFHHNQGLIKMLPHVPQVYVDTVEDAKSKSITCPECRGKGEIVEGSGDNATICTCHVCDGTKKVRIVGDKAARDIVFEAMNMTGKRAPMIAVQNNYDSGDLNASLRMVSGLLGRNAAPTGEVQDAEVVEEEK